MASYRSGAACGCSRTETAVFSVGASCRPDRPAGGPAAAARGDGRQTQPQTALDIVLRNHQKGGNLLATIAVSC